MKKHDLPWYIVQSCELDPRDLTGRVQRKKARQDEGPPTPSERFEDAVVKLYQTTNLSIGQIAVKLHRPIRKVNVALFLNDCVRYKRCHILTKKERYMIDRGEDWLNA